MFCCPHLTKQGWHKTTFKKRCSKSGKTCMKFEDFVWRVDFGLFLSEWVWRCPRVPGVSGWNGCWVLVERLVGWLVVVIDPLSLIFRSVENRTRAYLQLLNVRWRNSFLISWPYHWVGPWWPRSSPPRSPPAGSTRRSAARTANIKFNLNCGRSGQ